MFAVLSPSQIRPRTGGGRGGDLRGEALPDGPKPEAGPEIDWQPLFGSLVGIAGSPRPVYRRSVGDGEALQCGCDGIGKPRES